MLTETATLATALFTGAAVYVTLVEHPARLTCSTPTAIAGWRPSYRRATINASVIGSRGVSVGSRCMAQRLRWRLADGRSSTWVGSTFHAGYHVANEQALGESGLGRVD
jgi:hypothetical protein